MRILHKLLLTGALTALAFPVSADVTNHWSVGAGIGTTGYGGSVSYRFHDNLALTAGYSGFTYDGMDYESDDADYEGDFDIDVYGLTLDYFPFGGRFFLSAGAVRPDIAMQVVGRPKAGQTYEFNGTTYTSEDVGNLQGDVSLGDSVQPYLGLGWRGSHRSGLGVFSQVGVFLTDAEVNLSATGAANDPRLRQDLQREEDDLRDDVDKLSVYPVAVVGIEYTF
ncbi:ornithine uptake porin CarO type 1 [Halomonas shantousis]